MDKYSFGYMPLLLFISAQMAAGLKCGADQHNLNGLKCCTRCAAGQGVQAPCNSENDTVCRACSQGETFSSAASHDQPCTPCQICPQYSHVAQQCNQTHDTVCECDRHYYWSAETRSCRQCTLCALGYGMKRECDQQRDTACMPCPQGMYSDEISGASCALCTHCTRYQITLRTCGAVQDTMCVDVPSPKPTDPPVYLVPTTVAPVAMGTEKKTDTTSILIPVCIGALGLIIIISVICAIYKQIQNHRNPPNSPNNKKNISYSAVNDPAPTHAHTGVNAQQGSDSGVSLEHEPKSSTRVRDLAVTKLQMVTAMLHGCVDPVGGWSSFAKELGYGSSKIAAFETRAQQEGYKPADMVINEWSNNETATVEALVQVLRTIGREDIVAALYSDTRSLANSTPQKYLPGGHLQPHPASNYSPQIMSMAVPNQYAQQNMNSYPQQLYAQQNMQTLPLMGQHQHYPPQQMQQMGPSQALSQPQIYPPHEIITNPNSNAPPPVYLKKGAGSVSHSSEGSGNMSPVPPLQNFQPMHTQPTQQHVV